MRIKRTENFSPSEPERSDTRISRPRLWFVNTLIGLTICGSFYDIANDSDHWPFSNYAMYSEVQKERSLTVLRVFGMPQGSGTTEFPITDYRCLQPFDQARLRSALQLISYTPERGRLLKTALTDVLKRYEELRRDGKHDKPALEGVRLYRVSWQLDPWARNVGTPDRKDLIFEVRHHSE